MELEDKGTAKLREEHNRRIMENPEFQKALKTADEFMLLAWEWMENAIEESGDNKVRLAREKARNGLEWMSRTRPISFVEYFKQTAKELEMDKPIEDMTNEEKLNIMIDIFNGEAIEADL